MSYAPLSVVFINANEANPDADNSLFEPLWGVGPAGWYMTDEDGTDLFGPFDSNEEAHAELDIYIDDMESDEALREAFGE